MLLDISGASKNRSKINCKKVDGSRKVIKIVRDVVQLVLLSPKFHSASENTAVRIGYIYLPKFYRDFDENARNCSDDVKKK